MSGNLGTLLTGGIFSGSPRRRLQGTPIPQSAALIDDREWAEKQVQDQRAWDLEMSNTSWQRGIADMQAAGINPALAYMQGGASTPHSAVAQTSSTSQRESLQRERLMFGLLNSALGIVGKKAGAANISRTYVNVK